MSKFKDKVKDDTPRLEVKYRLMEGKDEYEWGIVPSVPMLSLIGGIGHAQMNLHTCQGQINEEYRCPAPSFVLAWSEESKKFDLFVHPSIPMDSLCGMLETIKSAVVLSLAARRVAAQGQIILGPDGRPIVQ